MVSRLEISTLYLEWNPSHGDLAPIVNTSFAISLVRNINNVER